MLRESSFFTPHLIVYLQGRDRACQGPAFTSTTPHGPLALCDLLTLDIPSFSDTPPPGWGWGIAPDWDFPQFPVGQNRLEQGPSAPVQAHTVGTGLFREEGPEEQEVEA